MTFPEFICAPSRKVWLPGGLTAYRYSVHRPADTHIQTHRHIQLCIRYLHLYFNTFIILYDFISQYI